MKIIKRLFNPPNHKFYSDWTPLEKAWWGLWKRPSGNVKTALILNKDLLEKMRENDAK